MSHALYAWTFHFEGVKRICELPDKRVCLTEIPSMPDIITAILKREADKVAAAIGRGVEPKHIYTIKAEDIYPVNMHFMTDLEAILPNAGDEQWFRNNLSKVRAAFGIDADERDTYLVVEE